MIAFGFMALTNEVLVIRLYENLHKVEAYTYGQILRTLILYSVCRCDS